MKKVFFILFLIPLIACDHNVSQSHQNTHPPLSINQTAFKGSWLVKEYFDTVNQPGYSGSLSASHLGVTEIVFSSDFRDSVLLITEDLEKSMEKLEVISPDTVRLSLTDPPYNLITYNSKTQTICYQIDERYPLYHFYKAPKFLFDSSGTYSAFRTTLNFLLAKETYHETGDSRYPESRSNVTLDMYGNVKGIEDYTTYKLIVNGDLGNIQDADRIEFSNGKQTYLYGIRLTRNGFDLYNLKHLSLPDEKPSYKSDLLFKSYTKNE